MYRLGQVLLSLSLIGTAVGTVLADWNRSHVFNPDWPPHAHFHAAAFVLATVGFSLLGLWLVWKRSADRGTCELVAATVPLLTVGTFFIVCLVPGAAVEDRPGQAPRLAGLTTNLVLPAGVILVGAVGCVLCRHARRRGANPSIKSAAGETGPTGLTQ
jgi:Family of unknown function (DUF6640)